MCTRRAGAVVVVALLLGLGGVRPADGVVGGLLDGEQHEYVGVLIGPLGMPICSGVLVACESVVISPLWGLAWTSGSGS